MDYFCVRSFLVIIFVFLLFFKIVNSVDYLLVWSRRGEGDFCHHAFRQMSLPVRNGSGFLCLNGHVHFD